MKYLKNTLSSVLIGCEITWLKNSIILLLINILIINAYSQTNNLIVKMGNGLVNSIDLSTIRSLKFQSSYLKINSLGNNALIDLQNIQRMTFGVYSSVFTTKNNPDLLIYPNPAQNFISINYNDIKMADVCIFTVNGINLISIRNCKLTEDIDISTLSKGVYFIRVDYHVIKFIKM